MICETIRFGQRVSHVGYIKNICYDGPMARPAKHPIKKVVGFDTDLLERVRDFRFNQRIASENEAIRRLIEAGLSGQAAPQPEKAGGKQPQVQRKGLPPAKLGRASSREAGDQDAKNSTLKPSPARKSAPRAKAATMSKEAQIRALRERDGS
jgi:hypothetical protein